MMILVRKIILYFRKNSFSFFRSLEIYENRSSRVTSESLLKFESVLYNTSYNFTCTFSCTTEAHICTHIHTHSHLHTPNLTTHRYHIAAMLLLVHSSWYILGKSTLHGNLTQTHIVPRTQNNIIICERKNLQSLCLCYVFHIPRVRCMLHRVHNSLYSLTARCSCSCTPN